MPFDYEDFARDAAKDAASDLASGLIVAGVKGVFRAARAGLSALAANDEEPLTEMVETSEELLAETVVEAFLLALHDGDHELACALCAQTLLEHPVRQAVLEETLAAAAPIGWTCVEIQELKHNQFGPIHVLFALDVEFEAEPGHEFLHLKVQLRWLGSEWKIWELAWVEYAE